MNSGIIEIGENSEYSDEDFLGYAMFKKCCSAMPSIETQREGNMFTL